MRYLSFLLLLVVPAALTAQSTVESVPNQKLITGSYVSNPDNILDPSTVAQIDSLLSSLEKKTTVQAAVVVLKSIENGDEFEFARELFDSWGIGQRENDNGLLVLFVEDIHAIRFHTGYGVEGVLPDVVCKRIQRDYMVPEFRNGNYSAGMLSGLQQVEKVLTDPAYAEELKKPEGEEVSDWTGFVIFLSIFFAPVLLIVYLVKAGNKRFLDSKNPEHTLYPEMRMKRWPWLLEFAGVPLLTVVFFSLAGGDNAVGWCFLTLYLFFMLTLFHRLRKTKKVITRFLEGENYQQIHEFLRQQQWYWFFMGLLFPFPFLPYFFYHLARKRIYRNHSRKCTQCNGPMRKLDEKADDAFLTEGQRMEETLRSVDYDVWQCGECEAIGVWFYLNRHSKYKACPKCNTIACHTVSKQTVVSATYSASGRGEESHACKFCGHQYKTTYTIPMLVRSTSSSSSGGGSSGGSWGGGRSGGGGASSRW